MNPRDSFFTLLLLSFLIRSASLAEHRLGSNEANWLVERMAHEILENHPGALPGVEAGFQERFADGKAAALKLASRVHSRKDAVFALRAFAAKFLDQHLNVIETSARAPAASSTALRYPGFLVAKWKGDFTVSSVTSRGWPSPLPQIGDRIIACDGKPLAELILENRFRFGSNPMLQAHWIRETAQLFIDESDPFITLPSACIFERNSTRRTLSLSWQQADKAELTRHLNNSQYGVAPSFGVRRLNGDVTWLSIPSFNLHDQATNAEAVKFAHELETLGTSDYAVIDLRGNTGGVGLWALCLAQKIVGYDYLMANSEVRKALWGFTTKIRSSAGNARQYELWREKFASSQDWDPVSKSMLNLLAHEVAAAHAKGRLLTPPLHLATLLPPSSSGAVPRPKTREVYVLTDGRCFSACLFFLDWIKQLPNVTHIGSETDADTQYTDSRSIELYPGITLNLPMHLMIGRRRGVNEPHIPSIPFRERYWSDQALERFVLTLRHSIN